MCAFGCSAAPGHVGPGLGALVPDSCRTSAGSRPRRARAPGPVAGARRAAPPGGLARRRGARRGPRGGSAGGAGAGGCPEASTRTVLGATDRDAGPAAFGGSRWCSTGGQARPGPIANGSLSGGSARAEAGSAASGGVSSRGSFGGGSGAKAGFGRCGGRLVGSKSAGTGAPAGLAAGGCLSCGPISGGRRCSTQGHVAHSYKGSCGGRGQGRKQAATTSGHP